MVRDYYDDLWRDSELGNHPSSGSSSSSVAPGVCQYEGDHLCQYPPANIRPDNNVIYTYHTHTAGPHTGKSELSMAIFWDNYGMWPSALIAHIILFLISSNFWPIMWTRNAIDWWIITQTDDGYWENWKHTQGGASISRIKYMNHFTENKNKIGAASILCNHFLGCFAPLGG